MQKSKWEELATQVIAKWKGMDCKFAKYFEDYYLKEEAVFHRSKWAASHFIPGILVENQTNNHAENYHREMNRYFDTKPTMKGGLKILKLVEKITRSNMIHHLHTNQVPFQIMVANDENEEEKEAIALPTIEQLIPSLTSSTQIPIIQTQSTPPVVAASIVSTVSKKRPRKEASGKNPLETERKRKNRRAKKSNDTQYQQFMGEFVIENPSTTHQTPHEQVTATSMLPAITHVQQFFQPFTSTQPQQYISANFSLPAPQQYMQDPYPRFTL